MSTVESTVRRQYAAVHAASPNAGPVVVLHIGNEEAAIAAGSGHEPELVFLLDLGAQSTARTWFIHTPPTPLEMENAIAAVEDEIMRIRTLIPGGAALWTADAALREVAALSGIAPAGEMILSLEATERTFDRLASVVLGSPASRAGLPENAEFAASLLILREFMHHLRFSEITCLAMAAGDGKTGGE
ncbi:MAG: hypothetical protein ACM3SV_03080 [Betaproteobacteria bacterium]